MPMKSASRRSLLQVRILLRLKQGPARTISELAVAVGARRPSVSRSLKTLRNDELVEDGRNGWTLTLAGEEEAKRCNQELSRVADSLRRTFKGVNSENTNSSEGSESDTSAKEASSGMSPYATGGGGVTFERKVAVQYLAQLLVGDSAVEFGEGRCAVSVAFQQALDHPVDDLVVCAARPEELQPSWEIALEVRRSPNLVLSDEPTQGLIRKFVRALIDGQPDGLERRLGLVVAGTQTHAQQLGKLADLAAAQMDAPGFFKLVRTPNKFDSGVRNRLGQIEKLVERALKDLDGTEPDTELVGERTWQLLSRLVVLMPRLESPDETDWSAVENSLIAVSRTSSLEGASRLRDRLVALASDYSPKAARVDLKLLRRDAYEVLELEIRRHKQGWSALNHLHEMALEPVRDEIATNDKARRLSLDRSTARRELVATVSDSAAVLVSGDSGVGKSALTLLSLTAAPAADSEGAQALCINLRHVPRLTLDFEDKLSCPLSALLSELSAPQRVLVVDVADAVTEGMEDAFRYLVDAAVESQVKVVAVTSIDSVQVVRDILTDRFGAGVAEYAVKPLTDTELDDIVTAFPELEGLKDNPRSRELLRRLVVVDLLVRGHLTGVPLSDADAMDQVWSGLVRRRERSDRGYPDAREVVLLRLAALSLSGGERLDVISGLDANAISGLQQDGLLQPSLDNLSMIGPDFSHDEVRRYAIARLLLAELDPTSRILSAGAPRWVLGAARLSCQALLDELDTAARPLRGRFAKLQASFDRLVEAGYGARWGDVPCEALITLADPSGVLRDAWPKLQNDDATGLRRLARLVNQRLRDDNGIVDPVAIEPIVELLLEDNTPWRSGEYASDLLREWLSGHAFAGTSAGHPLRILLRERLVEACIAGDRRLEEEREAAAAARAARTPEEVERVHRLEESHPELFTEIGYGGRRRRQRPEVPRECRDEVFLELLALLGPDLGDDGEAILRRVARDAPSWLAPAVEETFTGLALSQYRPGLLAQLTEAYYLDDEADGAGLHDDGVRHHRVRRGGLFMPHAAWHRGPFMSLFPTNFRGGVAVLNRLLNHAALHRARTLARLSSMSHRLGDIDVSPYQADLNITGTRRLYVGDEHVWMWYRGTGVGPYPCMSALQALERTCDRIIKDGIPIKTLVPLLLNGCENLAMVGLVVGILVRHLEVAGNLLDPYLTEPFIWSLESRRVANEHTANSEGIEAPERRKWFLREAAMAMTLRAGDERVQELQTLGETLVERARRRMEQGRDADSAEEEASSGEDIEQQLAKFRAWASSLDRSKFQVHEAPDGLRIQATPPEEVLQALQHDNEELERVAEEIRLTNRYFFKLNEVGSEAIEPDELTADIAFARKLLENPPSLLSAHGPLDVPALVAAAALEAYLLRGVDVPNDALVFVVDTVLRVSEGEVPPGPYEFEETYFEQGADRSAARVLPLLLMPAAAHLRAVFDGADGSATFKRASTAGLRIAQAVANEVRLHLALGLDHLWATSCTQDGPCHHQVGWQIATETMRDCALGDWIPETGVRSVTVLDEPLAESLANTADDSILPSRLDASIRALAPAAKANICVSTSACDLLTALLVAQRRSLLNYENNMDQRGTHSLVSARALLTLAQHGDDAAIYEHIDAYADNSALLGNLLYALSAAAEETPDCAATARRVWPSVVRHVLDLHNRGHVQFRKDFYGEMALAALIPNAAYEAQYLYRELQEQPIVWWEPLALRSEVEAWLAPAAGNALCVDQLIGFLRMLAPDDQARVGLPWVANLVLASPGNGAKGSYLVATWLIETRSAAESAGLSPQWQQVVDALVVEGVTQLAPYSE